MAERKTVLLARFSALGDVAMTVPAVYSVCRSYPGVHFVFVTRPVMTSIFVCAPPNLTVVGADIKKEYAGVAGLRRLVGNIVAKYRPDIFVDLHNVLRTRIMSVFLRLKGIPTVRICKPRAKRRELTRRRDKVVLPLVTQHEYYREALRQGGFEPGDRFDNLYGGPCQAPSAQFAAVSAPKPEGQRWVGIAPFAAHEGKVYPPQLMEKVLARLQADADGGADIRVFLFGGGKSEQAVLDDWADKYPCVVSLAGKRYGFPAELALINHLDVIVTMDSANMHLAAIAGAPTVSIWGATHPYCGFKGWRQTDSDTIQLAMECRPCSVFGSKPCFRGDRLCMTAIKPELIYNKIIDKLALGRRI